MRNLILFAISSFLAAAVPLVHWDRNGNVSGATFPGWPTQFEGRILKQLDLSEREERFARDFPGKIAKFSDGNSVMILRWVTHETRKLHPAADCFRSSGYRVHDLPASLDSSQSLWGRFKAVKGGETFQVSERICDNHGNAWSDASAWYWAALLGRSTGPWWAVTVIESMPN